MADLLFPARPVAHAGDAQQGGHLRGCVREGGFGVARDHVVGGGQGKKANEIKRQNSPKQRQTTTQQPSRNIRRGRVSVSCAGVRECGGDGGRRAVVVVVDGAKRGARGPASDSVQRQFDSFGGPAGEQRLEHSGNKFVAKKRL